MRMDPIGDPGSERKGEWTAQCLPAGSVRTIPGINEVQVWMNDKPSIDNLYSKNATRSTVPPSGACSSAYSVAEQSGSTLKMQH